MFQPAVQPPRKAGFGATDFDGLVLGNVWGPGQVGGPDNAQRLAAKQDLSARYRRSTFGDSGKLRFQPFAA